MPHDIQAINFEAAITINAAAGDSKKTPTFAMEAYTGVPMRQFFLKHPVVMDFAGINIDLQAIPARYHHNALEGVGHTTKIEIRNGSLWAEGVISRDTEAAREVVASAKKGFPWQASIGASVQRMEFVEQGAKAEANGKTHDGPIYIARQSTLNELSFVDLGADKDSSAAIAAAAANKNGANEMPTPAPEAKPTQTPTPTPPVEAAAAPTPAPAPKSIDAVLAAAKIEAERQDAITVSAASVLADNPHAESEIRALADAAMNAKDYSAERFALEAHRVGNTYSFGKPRKASPADDSSMIEASLCIAGGMAEEAVLKEFGEDTIDAAHTRFNGNIGLVESIGIAAQSNGFDGRVTAGNLEEMMRHAFPVGIQAAAGQSTISLPGILSNVANKFLRDGFDSVEDSWRKISSIRSVSDFKAITSHSLTGNLTYEKIAPGGELKHGSLGEETYTNKAETYGRMMGISRHDLMNDNLGALTKVFAKLGRGGHIKLNKVLWGVFMNNAAFFTTGRGNYATGASTTLDIAGYTAAEKMFYDQTDPNDDPISIEPAVLLVPNGLKADADVLMHSKEVHGSSAKTPTQNPHRGKAEVVRSSYLNQTGVTGSSELAWFLLGNPLDLPVLEVCFLNGVQRPTVERAQANFNTLGIDMRGFFDFGVSLQEYRGGVKMKGEA